MYGESTRGFDPRTIDSSNCVMIWGANPSTSAPQVHQYWLAETAAPKIVIDLSLAIMRRLCAPMKRSRAGLRLAPA